MYFALCCVLFGILVSSPETDGSSLTWLKPMPFQVVPRANRVDHQNRTRLIEGTINASLIWHFNLSSELTFVSLNLLLDGATIASDAGVSANSRDKYAVNFIQSSEIIITLVIFEVTAAVDGIFSCEVYAREQTQLANWKSNVQVDFLAPPSNIVTSSRQTVTVPAVLFLNCSAYGEPDPNKTWTKVSDNTIVTMPLNITGEKDGGSYRCTVDNGVGKPLTKEVFVDVQFPPMVKGPSIVYVRREQNVFLTCEVEGNPPPIISWSPCSEKNVCDERYLNITKVQTARANYTCTATNSQGVDLGTTLVIIGGKDVFLRLSVSGECDNKDSVWETLQKELVMVFTNNPQNYSGADLIDVRCGRLIFDVGLKFRTEVAEDDIISIIKNAIVDGKLGELSVNVSHIIGIPPPTTTDAIPTSTTPKPHDDKTGLIIGVVLGGVAFVALIALIIWCVRKKKCCSKPKEVSDNTDSAQGRKGKGQNGTDEVAYASTSMLPHSKRPVEKASQSTGQALPMYAQVDKTKKISNKGGAAQRQRQPGELNYAEVEHVTSGRSLPRKSSSEPIKPSNEEIVYADLV